MLKKLAILSLVMFYSFASFGLSVNLFYCCGELEEVSIQVSPQQDEECNMHKNCCEDKEVEVKVPETQWNHGLEVLNLQHPGFLAITPPAFFTLQELECEPAEEAKFSETGSPPFVIDRPIFFSVFRI